jgi:hypothetical protein
MNIEQIDFPDMIDRHSYYQPVYRVDFWLRDEPAAGGDPEVMGYRKTSHRVRGAKSVSEVREWADANAQGRGVVIWIELPPEDDRTIARIEGVDPTIPNRRHLAE